MHPSKISVDMVRIALGETKGTRQRPMDPWHVAANLNAMLEFGYCRRCGMCPAGCEREGCGAEHQQQ